MLSRDYDIKTLCSVMGVSRAGFYKWKRRGRSSRELRAARILKIAEEVHIAHPSHGYRWVHAYIQINYDEKCSASFIYKAFKVLGIQSETRHKERRKARKEKDNYPNLIFSTWETVDRPRQVIVSDMTAFHVWVYYIEVTFYFDVFTKQILSWKMAERRGDRNQYIDGMKEVAELLRGNKEPTILHTDQGSVYSSKAYNELIKDENIVRSMSRVGKPTDNPVNESLNGWIKEELYMDFRLSDCRSREEIRQMLETYVDYYNKQRPSYALGYDTPDNYCRRYRRGEIEHRETFKDRVLTDEPKFVQKRKNDAPKMRGGKKETQDDTDKDGDG